MTSRSAESSKGMSFRPYPRNCASLRGAIIVETAVSIAFLVVTCFGLAALIQTVVTKMNHEIIYTELMLGPQSATLQAKPNVGQPITEVDGLNQFGQTIGDFFLARNPAGSFLLVQLGYVLVSDGAPTEQSEADNTTLSGAGLPTGVLLPPVTTRSPAVWGSGACGRALSDQQTALRSYAQDTLDQLVAGLPSSSNELKPVGIKLFEITFMERAYKRYMPAYPVAFLSLCTEVSGPTGGRTVTSKTIMIPRVLVQ